MAHAVDGSGRQGLRVSHPGAAPGLVVS
jgi:hypothetical protein